MHRFFVEAASEKEIVTLDPKESHHALSVLRVKAGEAVELLDGKGGTYGGFIAKAEKGSRVEISVQSRSNAGDAQDVEITLAPAVIKPERMEWMLEKSCELGVRAWQPLLTERGVVKLSAERWQGKASRWRKIAQESCKQCGLSRVPEIGGPLPFGEFVKRFHSYDAVFFPTLAVKGETLKAAMEKRSRARKVLIVIGPEGDFTPKETQSAVSAGAIPVTLGPLVLRSETAAIFGLSTARFFYASPDGQRVKKI
jgi:16S rRNA (uracil1498-N3)-methyltransferase